jgi:hypothetical protein
MDEAETDDLISADMIQEMQDFEKEEYASTMDTRVTTTIESLNSIGHYLSGISGRKNLVWISQSFPISLVPDLNSGKNEFLGTRQYGEQVEMTANTLSDAQDGVPRGRWRPRNKPVALCVGERASSEWAVARMQYSGPFDV